MSFSGKAISYTKSAGVKERHLIKMFPPVMSYSVPLGLNTSPTHGCVRSELRVENYLVSLLDVGGAPESRAVWREVYGDVHGIIFVVDSSDRQRIKEVKEVLSEMLKQPRVAGKPILV